MTVEERQTVDKVFGGVQRAFDKVVKDAQEEEGWLPSLPKRLIPAFRAIREYAITRPNQNMDSKQLRDAVIVGCDCQRKTAIRHVHELKRRDLIYTFGACGDEHMHFVACSQFDQKTIHKINSGEKIDPDKYFLEKYGA